MNPTRFSVPAVCWGRALTALYLGTLFVMGSLPITPGRGGQDKVLHFVAFGGLTPLLFWSLPKWPPIGVSVTRRVVSSAAGATLVGGLLELWQMFWPARTADWEDLAFDFLGAAIAALLLGAALRSGNTGG